MIPAAETAPASGARERALEGATDGHAETAAALREGAAAVVRLSARMPATMRGLGLADRPIERGSRVFESTCRGRGLPLQRARLGRRPSRSVRAAVGVATRRPAELKRAAPAGRGRFLARSAPRPRRERAATARWAARTWACRRASCVVCGGTAAECSAGATHRLGRRRNGLLVDTAALRQRRRTWISGRERRRRDDRPCHTSGEIETKGGDTP
ncbi:MAG: hypothetical protein MZV70_67965 [Desulfobacterales bacterium]|nr:hypothetical protein [Desulfobacterales bacterium]